MKIIIELPSWLGDAVMASPAIENLIECLNEPEVTIVGSSIAIEALSSHPKVRNTYVLKKNYIDLYKTIKMLGKFDMLFSFRGSFRSKLFKFLISSKKKYQFDKNNYKNIHQVEKYNSFINDSLGLNTEAKKLIVNAEKTAIIQNNKILGINPGASYGSAKRWYPEEFATVAASLSDHYDILIFGGPDEIDISNQIEDYLIKNKVTNYTNLAGKTSIKDLIEHISSLDLMVTSDSGPMHLAAAFQIPTVSIFGPTMVMETSQWMNEKSTIVKKDLVCQPCMKRTCPLKHHNCMRLVKASDVLLAVNELT
jgi:heptosyltransferase-2